jgi:hypothetical protein
MTAKSMMAMCVFEFGGESAELATTATSLVESVMEAALAGIARVSSSVAYMHHIDSLI